MAISFFFFNYSNMNGFLLSILYTIANVVLVVVVLMKVKEEKMPSLLLLIAGGLNIFTHLSWFFQPTQFYALAPEFQTAVSIISTLTITIPYILLIIGYGGLISATGLLQKKNDEDGSIWLILTGILWGVAQLLDMIAHYAQADYLYTSHSVGSLVLSIALGVTTSFMGLGGSVLLLLYGKKSDNKFMMIAGLAFLAVVSVDIITSIIGML